MRADGANDKPAQEAGAAQKDYAAELPRIPLKDPAESTQGRSQSGPASASSWPPPSRCCAARSRSTSTRTAGSTSPSFPSTTSTPTRSPTARAVSACWKTPTATVFTTRARVFASDVPMATAVACWDGGVYVGSAPDLLYLKDTDGDGKADVRRVVFTGFGNDPAGEGMLNSFRWGLDNRFHVSTSLDGG